MTEIEDSAFKLISAKLAYALATAEGTDVDVLTRLKARVDKQYLKVETAIDCFIAEQLEDMQ